MRKGRVAHPFFHSDSMLWVAHPFALFAKGWDSECTRQTRDPSSHAGARALPHHDLLPSLTGSRRVGKTISQLSAFRKQLARPVHLVGGKLQALMQKTARINSPEKPPP